MPIDPALAEDINTIDDFVGVVSEFFKVPDVSSSLPGAQKGSSGATPSTPKTTKPVSSSTQPPVFKPGGGQFGGGGASGGF